MPALQWRGLSQLAKRNARGSARLNPSPGGGNKKFTPVNPLAMWTTHSSYIGGEASAAPSCRQKIWTEDVDKISPGDFYFL
jgi:hypothetical protein